MSTITTLDLSCGATLVVEPLTTAASAAICCLLPVGAAGDPAEAQGESAALAEYIFRGADGLGSREHSDALDRLGVQRSSHVAALHLPLEATCLGTHLEAALPLLVGMVRRPALEASALPAVRSLCIQSLDGLDDDPQRLCGLRLHERHLPPPFDRHGYGRRDHLEALTIDGLLAAWPRRAAPRGTIIGAAGRVDGARLASVLDRLLEGWVGSAVEPAPTSPATRGHQHFPEDSAQVHVGIAFDAPPAPHPRSMVERLAIRIFGGASSSRLFTEVREKRGLCYSVGASYRAGRDRGHVSIYAGSTPERGQETVDVIIDELRRLRAGVRQEELDRASVGLKSRLIMQGESTAARAGAIAGDMFRHGRPRSLAELAAEVDDITLDDVNAYLADRDPGELTLVSVGPVELQVATEVT